MGIIGGELTVDDQKKTIFENILITKRKSKIKTPPHSIQFEAGRIEEENFISSPNMVLIVKIFIEVCFASIFYH